MNSRFERELRSIFNYIRQDSPNYAADTIARILDELDRLVDPFPVRHKIVGRSRSRGNPIHALSIPPYIVYYRVDHPDEQVVLMRVLHGARRQPSRFE
jgi:plasmid stabilization system protein ParE